jgi:hypothetical protein
MDALCCKAEGSEVQQESFLIYPENEKDEDLC